MIPIASTAVFTLPPLTKSSTGMNSSIFSGSSNSIFWGSYVYGWERIMGDDVLPPILILQPSLSASSVRQNPALTDSRPK
ncbi:unknown [Methanoculleus sp. CAG:1088]|nr:unknown [Methanoculleus sp. CAG:1088]